MGRGADRVLLLFDNRSTQARFVPWERIESLTDRGANTCNIRGSIIEVWRMLRAQAQAMWVK